MPNNFKLQGDLYVSKAGNNANDGLTPETPLLTVQAALDKITTAVNRTIIIGSGVYKENISKSINFNATITLTADGKVIIEPINQFDTIVFSSIAGSVSRFIYNKIHFRNGKINFNSFAGADYQLLNGCIISNAQVTTSGFLNALSLGPTYPGGVSFINTQIINSSIFVSAIYANENAFPTTGTVNIDGCVLINSSVSGDKFILGVTINNAGVVCLRNTYIDPNSTIQFYSNLFGGNSPRNLPATGNVTNNNIQGKLIFAWLGTVSGVNSYFVPISFEQSKIDYPTYNVNSFSSDPKFNNPRLLDFTLQAGSPNVSASTDFSSNIGGTEYAVPFTASSAAFTTNATSQSLEYRGIYYSISGSATTGSITSGPMFLQWPRTKPLTSVNWIGALEFNKTITASLAGNNNVPAYTTFTSASGLAGANPDRLKIRLRYSTQETQPSTDAEWDNGSYWPAGTYQLFEINQKPKVDYKGTGNGDPTYVETSAIGDLVPSWIQTEIILRNDYNR